MKQSFDFVKGGCCLLLAFMLMQCQHPSGNGDPAIAPQTGKPGTVKPVGRPRGTATTKLIGVEGGTIATPDGVSLTIPAGALATATAISIQPITRTLPGGAGPAVRLSPDGQQFAKPVTLTIAYVLDSLTTRQPDMLMVAYQDDKGIWQSVREVQVDKNQQHITATIHHFSDWSVAERYSLKVDQRDLFAGEQTAIHLLQTAPLQPLSPDGNETDPIYDPVDITRVGDWQLTGQGTLGFFGEFANYQAPDHLDKPITVSVSVEVKPPSGPGKIILIATISVSNGFIDLNYDGVAYHITDVSAVKVGNTLQFGGQQGSFFIGILTNRSQGVVPFGDIGTDKGSASSVTMTSDLARPVATGFGVRYTVCTRYVNFGWEKEEHYTGGRVSIAQAATVLEGEISGLLARQTAECKHDTKPLSGHFRLKLYQ